jgi:hypothetical protein
MTKRWVTSCNCLMRGTRKRILSDCWSHQKDCSSEKRVLCKPCGKWHSVTGKVMRPRRSKVEGWSYFMTDGQSVSMSWYRAHSKTFDQILLPVGMLLSETCGLVSVERPLWREDGSAICSVITHWSEWRRTRNRTLLSHLRLPKPGGPGSRIYIPQEQFGSVIPPGIGL